MYTRLNIINGELSMSDAWSKFKKEIRQALEEVENLIGILLQDRTVPRNIKRKAQLALENLKAGDDSPAVLASNAISYIDDLSTDPNCPYHTRTMIYRLMSLLETIRD
jgi:uncharacterized protein (UPF0147 family)